MKTIRALNGVIPVIQTPLFGDGSFDSDGQVRLINFLNRKKVNGFWGLGTGSEDMNLTFDKRKAAAETICKANAGVIPLVIGCGFFCFEDTLRFIEETQNFEFDAYHYMPYHPLLSCERIAYIYKRIADFSQKPVFMYTSANWAQPITPKFVEEMMEYKNICGIKFSSSNTVDQLKVINLQSHDFQVITAVANQFFAALSMGSKSGTTSMAGALPEPLMELYEYFVGGDFDTARSCQIKFQNFTSMLPKKSKTDNFLTAAEEKFILSLRGICEPHTSDYYRDLDEHESLQVEQALAKSGYRKYIDEDIAVV